MDFRNTPLLRRLIFSSGLRFLAMVIASIAYLVLQPYMLAKLGPNDCGLMVIVATIVSIIGLMEAGLNPAIGRQVATAIGTKDDVKLLQSFNSGFFLFAFIGVLAVALTFLLAENVNRFVDFSHWLRKFLDPQFIPTAIKDAEQLRRNIDLTQKLLLIVSVQFAFELVMRALVGVISGSLRTDLVSAVFVGIRIMRPLLCFAVLYFDGGVVALSLSGFILTLLLGITWYRIAMAVAPQLKIRWRYVDGPTIVSLYKYSLFAFLAFASRSVNTAVAVIAITSLLGVEQVAIYNMICVTLIGCGNELIMMMIGFLSPVFAQLDAQKQTETIRKALFFSIKVSTMTAVFVAFGLVAWGHPFILRWMCRVNPENIVAYVPLAILAFTILFEQAQAPTVEFLFGTATHRYYAFANLIEAGVAILVIPVLTFYFQLVGVAIGVLAASAVARLVYQPLFVCKVLEIPLKTYYTRFALLILKGAVCLIVPAWITWMLVTDSYPSLFLVGFLSAGAYAVTVAGIVFTREERELVLNALWKKRTA